MSIRELIAPDCQGANSLMRLGSHIRNDTAFKDEGFGPSTSFAHRTQHFGSDELVSEFLGQAAAAPPQSFRMDALLQEMRQIDAQSFHNRMVQQAPLVIAEVNNDFDWANEFSNGNPQHLPNYDNFAAIENNNLNDLWNQNIRNVTPGMIQPLNDKPWESEFFDVNESLQQMVSAYSCKY